MSFRLVYNSDMPFFRSLRIQVLVQNTDFIPMNNDDSIFSAWLRPFGDFLERRLAGSSMPNKLKLMVALPVTIFLLGGAVAFLAVQSLVTATQPVINQELPALVYENLMNAAFHKCLELFLASQQISLGAEERIARLKSSQESFNYFEARLDAYAEQDKSAAVKEALEPVLKSRSDMKKAYANIIQLSQSVNNDPAGIAKVMSVYEKELRPTAKVVEDALDELAGLHVYSVKATQAELTAAAQKTTRLLIAITFLGTLIVILLGSIILWQTLRMLNGLSERIGFAFSEMAASSLDLSGASEKLSSGTAEASTSIDHAARALQNIDEMVGQTLRTTLESKIVSDTSRTAANSGAAAISSVIDVIGIIHSSSARLNDFKDIFAAIRIQTRAIDAVVLKAQILSFNAAIEAARAGQRSGFSAVAQEIGALAALSLEASKKISSLIEKSSIQVDGIVVDIQERVNNGQEKARGLADSFSKVLTNVSEVHKNMNQISGAAEEQAGEITRITATTNELKHLIFSNSTVSSQVTQTSRRLNEQAVLFEVELATVAAAIGKRAPLKRSA